MIRVVYKDKVESFIETTPDSVTYYRGDLLCKEFKDEETAEVFAEAIETPPQNKAAMQEFLDKMGISYLSGDTNAVLTEKINGFLQESNYPPEWEEGVVFTVGDVIEFKGIWYRVLQSHTSQKFWQPDMVPALFVETSPPTEIPEWKQPTGEHDAYNIGDQVMFNGKVYESVINANVWSPTVYAAGWKLIE